MADESTWQASDDPPSFDFRRDKGLHRASYGVSEALRRRLTMPLPNDEKLIALSEEILKQLEDMFGSHPGFRPVHAKGILFETERGQSSLLTQRMSTSRPGKCQK